MKPETAAFLDKSRECLAKADGMLANWPDEAGRAAYLAGLHAAQALIVERTGRIVRSHRGVQRELGRLTKDDPGFDRDLRAFPGRAYNLKAIADYETGPGSEVSEASAVEAITEGKRFVARMIELVEAL
ncbi:MAG: HEPN domain-containing protein [Acetobacteraceae bacterium]|nr:HEPN domain-containing protein [Acetobacteraceae bacterium]